MAIRKFKPSSPDKALGKVTGDTEFARLGHLNRLVDDITNELSNVSGSTDLPFKEGSIGHKVSFTKANYSNTVDVIIPGVLELARGNDQGLYNAALQSGWNNPGPTHTEWSSPFIDPAYTNWAPLWNLDIRTFDTWIKAVEAPNGDQAPSLQVGMPMILRETTTQRMWLIMFKSWTPNGNGGGFSYDRWEIISDIEFEKPNYQTQIVDKISDGVWLARGNNGPLYNAKSESESIVKFSPLNTRWNSVYTDSRPGYSGSDDLSNVESRVYTDFVLALDYNVGAYILDTELIMHDLTTDIYHVIKFNGWTSNNNGGGFSYIRKPIPQSKGIKFADGTEINSAAGVSSGSTGKNSNVDENGNFIDADSSNNTVSIGPGEFQLIDNFSGMLLVNDHYNGSVEMWLCGGGPNAVLVSRTDYGPGPGTMTMASNGYKWYNDSNQTGPFTFTVIKTRNGS